MKKYLPAIVAGFIAGVLHVVPLAKSMTCCLIVPLAAFGAILLDQKANPISGNFDLKRGALLGFLTGLFAALFGSFFDIFITFITRNNDIIVSLNEITKLMDSLPVPNDVKDEVLELMNQVADSIKGSGFSLLYSVSVIFNNLLVNTIFGTIGGLIGTKVINARNSD